MVEVSIDSIRVSLMSQQRIVILREKGSERYLPIWIGVYEAESITLALQEVEVARPLTHDLLTGVFRQLDARIVRVEVVNLRDDTFYGNIVAEKDGRTINIDARPSDALAVAVRAHVPILVAREVLNSAGITPEEDLQDSDSTAGGTPFSNGDDETADNGDERLSIFSDFLENLDLGDDDTSDEDPQK
jgi:bifunctional DNase/RNase